MYVIFKKVTLNIGRVEMINAIVDATTNRQDVIATSWKTIFCEKKQWFLINTQLLILQAVELLKAVYYTVEVHNFDMQEKTTENNNNTITVKWVKPKIVIELTNCKM